MATLWYFMGFRMMFPGRLTQGEGKRTQGWSSAWQHTLVIMALGRPKHEDQLKSKIQNQPSPHSEFKGMLVNTVTCLRGLKKKKSYQTYPTDRLEVILQSATQQPLLPSFCRQRPARLEQHGAL